MDDFLGFLVLLCIAAFVLPVLLAVVSLALIIAAAVLVVLGLLAIWAQYEKRKTEDSNPTA